MFMFIDGQTVLKQYKNLQINDTRYIFLIH